MSGEFLIPIITMSGLGVLFSSLLSFADKKLRVEENPLIGKVAELLPNANCGACGYAGCYDFASRLVEGKAELSKCSVCDADTKSEISSLLGIEADLSEKKVARILCRGDNDAAKRKAIKYYGPTSCAALALVGGTKLCQYGCLGGGDCVVACPFNAIFMNDNGLPYVIDELCTGCGLCVKACPRNIIELHPLERNVFVFCKSKDDPKTSKEFCKNACIGCGICARKSDGGIEMIDNLAIINYDKLDISKIPFDKCSTQALQIINHQEKFEPEKESVMVN
ncbi:MAG: RnfABCDGE type electron transport complex subunit B [Ignavibacteria bacterium]|nr:RnfABCDGE type electron transport complex subunit B [Ignavibacteria bacterium]